MASKELTIRFTWDADDLGPDWFNEDNLRQCLFSEHHTQPDLLEVEAVTYSSWLPTLEHAKEMVRQRALLGSEEYDSYLTKDELLRIKERPEWTAGIRAYYAQLRHRMNVLDL